ncbi:XdhC family protein [Adlercreutzia equolifaciens]|uniref:XdhC family protein n=1 Tax=Adlercreutzia equolifaciens TaxID=446660 RepID=A0A6L8Q141_9ACTN|nr:XdhC/CoxI family protein [Adlercreutzia equolifaciens]MCG4824235.1 XdhC family protein [Adlercreutzia equolifaciens]MZG27019.1 XdhC family protein [Adlercreutzia equolifaciens]
MREVASDVRRWFDEGRAVALAQVTKTWGSSPRVPGSVMAVADDGRLAGSVSGGCIEGAVAQVAMECAGSRLSSLEKFHASTRRAQEVGLSCGGNIEVFVGDLPRALFAVEEALIRADAAYARVTAVEAVFPGDRVDDPSQDDAAVREGGMDALGAMAIVADEEALTAAVASLAPAVAAEVAVARCDGAAVATAGEADCLLAVAEAVAARPASEDAGHVIEGGIDWFFARVRPAPQLVCIGGVHIAMRLAEIAHVMGFRTVVVDPRRVFATGERFPGVDELVHAWPQEAFAEDGPVRLTANTAVCALTHDPKIDVPALQAALASPAFYIGSLGRSTTQLSRCRQLAGEGCPDEQIARIYGPIGLDLRGREPAEIALSIMAEICAVRHGSPYELSTMLETARGLEGGEAA